MHGYKPNLGLCGASFSKNLTNKKQKNLKATFFNLTELEYCRRNVNDTIYTGAFWNQIGMVFNAEVMN